MPDFEIIRLTHFLQASVYLQATPYFTLFKNEDSREPDWPTWLLSPSFCSFSYLMNLQGYFTCIRWDFGYDSSMPEANEMAVSDFRAFLLHKIQHWVIKRFQKSPSWEIHLTERQRSAGTFQFTQRLNHLQEMNHYNNETAPSVFFLELMKYPPVPPKNLPLICLDHSGRVG